MRGSRWSRLSSGPCWPAWRRWRLLAEPPRIAWSAARRTNACKAMPLIGVSGRRLVWAAVAAAVLLAALLVTVTVTGPRVSVRWRPDIGPEARQALEARH